MRPSKKTCAIGLALATVLLAAGICWAYRVELFILPREWARVQEMRAEIPGLETAKQLKHNHEVMTRLFTLNGKKPPIAGDIQFWPSNDFGSTLIKTQIDGGYRWSLISSAGRLKPHELVLRSRWTTDHSPFRGRSAVFRSGSLVFECTEDGIVPLGFFTSSLEEDHYVATNARMNLDAVNSRILGVSQDLEIVGNADEHSSRNRALRYLYYANVLDDPISDIEALLKHPDRFVRTRAIAVLSEDPTIPPSLTRFLNSKDDLVRASAQYFLLNSSDDDVRKKAVLGSLKDRRPFIWVVPDVALDREMTEQAVSWIEVEPIRALSVIRDRLDAQLIRPHLKRLLTTYEGLESDAAEKLTLACTLCRTGDWAAIDQVMRDMPNLEGDIEGELFNSAIAMPPPTSVPAAWIRSVRHHARKYDIELAAFPLLIYWDAPNLEPILSNAIDERGYDDLYTTRAWARNPRVVQHIISSALKDVARFGPIAVDMLVDSPSIARHHKKSLEHIWRSLRSRKLWIPSFANLVENAEDPDLDALLSEAIEFTRSPDEGRILLTKVNRWNRVLPIAEEALRRWIGTEDRRRFSKTLFFELAGNPPSSSRAQSSRVLTSPRPAEPFAAFDGVFGETAASSEAALLLLRSKPEFLDEFLEGVAQPGNKWLLSPNLYKALSPQIVARLRQVSWATPEQKGLWQGISDALQKTSIENKQSPWEQHRLRIYDHLDWPSGEEAWRDCGVGAADR